MVTPGSRVPGMGQAVELYARYPGTTSTSASVCLNVAGAHGGDCTDVAATAIYARHQLCLPAHAQGIPFYLVAVLNGGAGTCATFPTESLHIDDAAIIDTVDCP